VAAALAVTVAGCGGGSSGVSAAAYTQSVCTALTTWRDSVQAAGTVLQEVGRSSLAEGKAAYVKFVGALESATRAAVASLRSAGTPAVDGGDALARSLVRAFTSAQDALDRAATRAGQIPTTSTSAFSQTAQSITTSIRSSLSEMSAVSPGTDPRLKAAASRQPECEALRSG
jgi:hypothetical protein